MQKTIYFLFAALILSFTSCNNANQVEKDAQEMAKLSCELYEILGDMMSGDETGLDRYNKLDEQGKELQDRVNERYPLGSEEAKEFERIFNEKFKECSGLDLPGLNELIEEDMDIDFDELHEELEGFLDLFDTEE